MGLVASASATHTDGKRPLQAIPADLIPLQLPLDSEARTGRHRAGQEGLGASLESRAAWLSQGDVEGG